MELVNFFGYSKMNQAERSVERHIEERYKLGRRGTKLDSAKVRKKDMNKLVMNFLVTEGYVEAAEKFRLESGTDSEIDIATITRAAVKKAVLKGNMEDAIQKVNDWYPEILVTNPHLSFHLQQQQLIELIRNGKVEKALEFAHAELAPKAEKDQGLSEELEMTVTLLAFEDVTNCPFSKLLDMSQRVKTASEVNAAILTQIHEKDPGLSSILEALISLQKWLHEMGNNNTVSFAFGLAYGMGEWSDLMSLL